MPSISPLYPGDHVTFTEEEVEACVERRMGATTTIRLWVSGDIRTVATTYLRPSNFDLETMGTPPMCEWFALCGNEATHVRTHPILKGVPICDKCEAKLKEIGEGS